MPAPQRRQRLAIVLFNLGGPDAPESVRPFLVNLFTDPAILRVPGFIRPWLGRLIAWRRTKPAMENYAVLGGKSPLLELTEGGRRAIPVGTESRRFLEDGDRVVLRAWCQLQGGPRVGFGESSGTVLPARSVER